MIPSFDNDINNIDWRIKIKILSCSNIFEAKENIILQ